MADIQAQRLDEVGRAVRRALREDRIGMPRAIHWLVRGPQGTALLDDMLSHIDTVFDCPRRDVRSVDGSGCRLVLAHWAGGQTATLSAAYGERAGLIDLVVLGSRGSLVYRDTGER